MSNARKWNLEDCWNALGIALIFYGIYYLSWRAFFTLNPRLLAISILCLAGEACNLVNFFFFVFCTWRMKQSHPFALMPGHTVDIFIATFNENTEVVEATLLGCSKITYPHRTYVLDDGRRPLIEALAKRYGAGYLTRPDNRNAKAGNINSALSQTDGEFILTLDADMIPQPNILDRALGYFVDESVAIIQFSQTFYNLNSIQHNQCKSPTDTSWNDQDLFYKTILVGRNYYDAAFWCGTPAVVRRAALAAVGGVATTTTVEDYQTSIRLMAAGWKVISSPENVAFGLAPDTLSALKIQRHRWAEGTTRILATPESPLKIAGLSMQQRIACMSGHVFYLLTPLRMFYVCLPLLLLSGELPVRGEFWGFLVRWLLVAGGQISYTRIKAGRHFRLLSSELVGMLQIFALPWGLLSAQFGKKLRFRVTPKQNEHTGSLARAIRELKGHILLFAVLSYFFFGGLRQFGQDLSANATVGFRIFGLFWVSYSWVMTGIAIKKAIGCRHSPRFYRFPVILDFTIADAAGNPVKGKTVDISATGARFRIPTGPRMSRNAEVLIEWEAGSIRADAHVLSIDKKRRDWEVRVDFTSMTEEHRQRWLEFLYLNLPPRWPTVGAPYRSTREAKRPPLPKTKRRAGSVSVQVLRGVIIIAALWASGARVLHAQNRSVDPIARGYELLNKAQIAEARQQFKRAAKDPAFRAEALQGLAYTELNAKDVPAAVKYAELHIKEYPDQADWTPKYLEIIRTVPERRAEVLELYTSYLKTSPDNDWARQQYADFLTWAPETRAQGVQQFKDLAAKHPGDYAIKQKLGRLELENGELREALATFAELRAKAPGPESDLGFLQTVRALKALPKARPLARALVKKYPRNPAFAQELKSIDHDIEQAYGRAFHFTAVSLKADIFAESTGFHRNSVWLGAEWKHRIRDYGAVYTYSERLSLPGGSLLQSGARLDQTHEFSDSLLVQGRLRLNAVSAGSSSVDYEIMPVLKLPIDLGKVFAGYRRNLLINSPQDQGPEPFVDTAGSSGQNLSGLKQGVGVGEAFAGFGIGGQPGWIYGGASYGRLSDGNNSNIEYAGGALSLLSPFNLERIQLYATVGSFRLSYRRTTAAYFSPPSFVGIAPGGQVHIVLSDELGVRFEAARTYYSPGSNQGWNLGASVHWAPAPAWHLYLRVRDGRDIYYRVQQGVVSATYAF